MNETTYTNYGGEYPVLFVEAVYDLSEYQQTEISITVPTVTE